MAIHPTDTPATRHHIDGDYTSDAAILALVDEHTPHLSIPRGMSAAECLRRMDASARLSVAGRRGEALAVCTEPLPPTTPTCQE